MNNKKIFIRCVGIDDKIHVCEPSQSKTKCGIKVKNKKMNEDKFRYSCYECTY
jgi:hypothetical protein